MAQRKETLLDTQATRQRTALLQEIEELRAEAQTRREAPRKRLEEFRKRHGISRDQLINELLQTSGGPVNIHRLNPGQMRQAVILSEVIGRPLALRGASGVGARR